MPNSSNNGKRNGAPVGNTNAIRHGLSCGMLPKRAKHVEIRCNDLRRRLEQAVLQAKGQVSLVDAACINTVCKWERHGMLALRWLREAGDTLKPLDRLHFSREMARASTERDRAIKCLALDAQPEAWLVVDGTARATPE